jgi:predicted Zn-dependent peptidase
MLAQERFLHSDNAALVVIGGVEQPRLMRTLRQLLGPWQKGDRSVAATFRQPNAPDERTLLINMSEAANAEVRLAWRGVSRADRDSIPASLLARIVRERWQAAVPELSHVSVRNEAHALPGMFVLAATVSPASAAKALSVAEDVMKAVAQNGVSAAELASARDGLLADMNRRSQTDELADAWLDAEILKTPVNVIGEINRAAITDVQRVAARLLKDAVLAKVVVADSAQLSSGLGGKIEVRNYQPEVRSASDPPKLPTKP